LRGLIGGRHPLFLESDQQEIRTQFAHSDSLNGQSRKSESNSFRKGFEVYVCSTYTP
jgi:hypothetical protein